MKNLACSFVFTCLLSFSLSAQTYIGAGFGYASLPSIGNDDVNGLSLNIQKQFRLDSGRWSISPSVQIGLLTPQIERDFYKLYATTLSIAPNISYDIIKTKHFVLSPYAGPFVGWLRGLRSGTIISDPVYLNEITYGLEVGLSFLIVVNDNLQLKILPIHLQYGNDDFRQGSISLLFKL
jgi:hypothetical protein